MDRLVRSLPTEIGCEIDECMFNSLAFADDLVLFGSTPEGLQILIDHTKKILKSCGLQINLSKCITISIKAQQKQKKTIVMQRSFSICGRELPALKRTDTWKYLGIGFSPEGKVKYFPQAGKVDKGAIETTRAASRVEDRLATSIVPQANTWKCQNRVLEQDGSSRQRRGEKVAQTAERHPVRLLSHAGR